VYLVSFGACAASTGFSVSASGVVNVCQLADRAFACSQLLFIYGLIFIYFPPHLFCKRFCLDTSAFLAALNGFCVQFPLTGWASAFFFNFIKFTAQQSVPVQALALNFRN